MLHRIQNIVRIDHFTVVCLWNDGQKRIIDFEKLMSDYPESIKEVILNTKSFKNIQYNKISKSVYFPDIIRGKDEKDNEILGALDFCPDVLFQHSVILN